MTPQADEKEDGAEGVDTVLVVLEDWLGRKAREYIGIKARTTEKIALHDPKATMIHRILTRVRDFAHPDWAK